jgi:ribosomal protein S4E
MALITKTLNIEFEEFELDEIIDFLKSKGIIVFKGKSITDAYKIQHIKEVLDDYTIREIQELLPKK